MPRTWFYVALALICSGATVAFLLRDPSPTAAAAVPIASSLTAPVSSSSPSAAPGFAGGGSTAPSRKNVQVQPATPDGSLLELWDSHSLVPEQQNEMTLYHTQVPLTALSSLAVGMTLQMAVPGREEPLRAKLDETHNTGAAVWSGPVQGGQPEDTLTVVRGQLETHITLATRETTLSVVVDNASGKALITDQNQLLMRATPDAIVKPNSKPLPPLAPPSRG
ncbi:hypothetical protein ACVW0Y_003294 [Pseudomonas sp. TE3786]